MVRTAEPVASAKAWHVDRNSGVPLYLQIRDFVHYNVSTGAFAKGQQLPGVYELAERLGINFETVRKAYKELERDGLIQMLRGKGTFVGPAAPSRPSSVADADAAPDPDTLMRDTVSQLLMSGLSADQIRSLADRALSEATGLRYLLFTECNDYDIARIGPLLQEHLGVDVRGVLLSELRAEVQAAAEGNPPLAVITTGFHLSEARRAVENLGVDVEAVVTNMSPETRREIERYPKSAAVGFVCRDAESIPFYRDMLKTELGLSRDIECAPVADQARIERMAATLDLILTSPPAFEHMREVARGRLPVFNVLDRVEPLSMLVIRERMFRDWQRARQLGAKGR
jgi:DNA-binding transcriptional regulator YhcF (GntR family)